MLQGLVENRMPGPSFRDALATEYVIDAVLKSAKNESWAVCR